MTEAKTKVAMLPSMRGVMTPFIKFIMDFHKKRGREPTHQESWDAALKEAEKSISSIKFYHPDFNEPKSLGMRSLNLALEKVNSLRGKDKPDMSDFDNPDVTVMRLQESGREL